MSGKPSAPGTGALAEAHPVLAANVAHGLGDGLIGAAVAAAMRAF
jgi:hypothetical protein